MPTLARNRINSVNSVYMYVKGGFYKSRERMTKKYGYHIFRNPGGGGALKKFNYIIPHCFICRPSESTVSKDAGIEPRLSDAVTTRLDLNYHSARSLITEIGQHG
jgi:hypothetical protein